MTSLGKRLGVIGGIGPESTIEYYRALVTVWQQRKGDGSYPPVVINSVDLQKLFVLMTANELGKVSDYLVEEFERLQRTDVALGLMAANSPHLVFNEVAARVSLPLLSIVEATCDAAQGMGINRLGLLGTNFTMQASFYRDGLAQRDMSVAIPNEQEREYIHDRYFAELVKGVIVPETRDRLLKIIARMKRENGIQGVILGGTELPLILRPGMDETPFLDTTQIHVEAAVERMLS